MNIYWDVTDQGRIRIVQRGFGSPDNVRGVLSGHLERALALGAYVEEDSVDAAVVNGTNMSEVVWTGHVPLQNVADVREFLMTLTAKDFHR